MAKKIKAANVAPLVTGEDAIKRFNGKNLQQIGKEAETLGVNGNQKGITALMCGLAFAAGRAARAKKLAKYDFKAEYNVYCERFYRGRSLPQENTSKTYLSNFNAFVEAGLKPWDATPIAVACLNVQGSAEQPLTLSWKAGKMRKLLEGEAAPAADAIKAAFTPKDKTGNTKVNQAGRMVGLLNAIDAYAKKKGFMEATPTFGSTKATYLRELFEAAYGLREELVKTTADAKAKGKHKTAAAFLFGALKKMPKVDRKMSA